MPIYEYRCTKCGEQFETLVRNPEEEKRIVCRSCEAPDVERLLSMFSGGSGGDKASSGCAPQKGFS